VPVVSPPLPGDPIRLTIFQSKRLYHIITTTVTVIAALSYFAMATDRGFTFRVTMPEHNQHAPPPGKLILRQVYWARYVEWSLATPLLLLDLFLLAGLSGANILIAVLADVVMCLAGLFASTGPVDNDSKWGWCVSLSNSFPGKCISLTTLPQVRNCLRRLSRHRLANRRQRPRLGPHEGRQSRRFLRLHRRLHPACLDRVSCVSLSSNLHSPRNQPDMQ
jgi:hypothetical protein